MTAICVNAPPMPVRTGALFFCSFFPKIKHLPPLLRHYLQNLVQYFKIAYVFSIWFQSFVLTSIDSCTCKCKCNHC